MPNQTTYAGINYAGKSGANQDKETGIHFGVINCNAISPDAIEDIYQNGTDLSFEAWKEEIKEKVKEAVKSALDDFIRSRHIEDMADDAAESVLNNDWLGDNFEGGGPSNYRYEDGELILELHSDGDIFVIKSPVVCNAQYCSPCAPGAGYLANPCADGPVCYCLPEDWFDEETPCPYTCRPAAEAFKV